jgi:hypothetical protein
MLNLKRLLLVAFIVQLGYILLLVALDAALPDYDTSASLVPAAADGGDACAPDWPQRVAAARRHKTNNSQNSAKPLLLVWDSVFYQRIAACGYEYEQYYAFFPGLPAAINALLLRLRGVGVGGGGGGVSAGAFAAAGVALSLGAHLAGVALLAR